MRNWLTFSTLLLLLIPGFTHAERIICFGDSLTAGYLMDPHLAYPSILEKLLKEKGRDASVVNAGVSGETSAGGLRRLSWVMREEADCLIIALGGNDALRGLPVEETRDNLRAIIRQAKDRNPQIRVILAGMLAPPNMGPEYAKAFAAIFPQLAKEESVQLYDFLLADVATKPELNMADGIHPRAEGHRKIAEGLLPLLLK